MSLLFQHQIIQQAHINLLAGVTDTSANSIAVNTIGETITTAQELITIVPIDAEMEMVCYVKNMDIADIEVGDEAEIKLEAYPYNKYGTISGTIT